MNYLYIRPGQADVESKLTNPVIQTSELGPPRSGLMGLHEMFEECLI